MRTSTKLEKTKLSNKCRQKRQKQSKPVKRRLKVTFLDTATFQPTEKRSQTTTNKRDNKSPETGFYVSRKHYLLHLLNSPYAVYSGNVWKSFSCLIIKEFMDFSLSEIFFRSAIVGKHFLAWPQVIVVFKKFKRIFKTNRVRWITTLNSISENFKKWLTYREY